MKRYIYRLSVPPTNEQGSYNIEIIPPANETPRAYALWHYNSARAHDGQEPLKRLPKGTIITKKLTYIVQGLYYGTWEDVTEENTRKAGLQRLQEYRENSPEYSYRLISRPETV